MFRKRNLFISNGNVRRVTYANFQTNKEYTKNQLYELKMDENNDVRDHLNKLISG